MRCWFCGDKLIWQCDYNFEDFGMDDREGVVAVLQCSNDKCKAEVVCYLPLDEEEE